MTASDRTSDTESDGIDDELFWEVAEPFMAAGKADEGVLMRSRCLRVKGEFMAMPEYRSGDLVVKLPAPRVSELIERDIGRPFAPAGRVFSEWVRIPDRDGTRWEALMGEAFEFASGLAVDDE